MMERIDRAERFIDQYYHENNLKNAQDRKNQIRTQIEKHGHYHHTEDELRYGAKLAWRNSNRCIGRLYWKSLNLFDNRSALYEEQVFNALLKHIDYTTNKGNIRSCVSIFNPSDVIIHNQQLIRYAGYQTEEGKFIGDPDSVDFTNYCRRLGWKPKYGKFDVLPIVIQLQGQQPKLFEIPSEYILEVELHHPTYDWFQSLGLKWYAVPIISNMTLEIGGISYEAAPFNGWYMSTEIAARNLSDTSRYNELPLIAKKMGFNTEKNKNLWKDHAMLALNEAVLYSYEKAGVKIVDQHTASEQFIKFSEIENDKGRDVTGDWSWLVPPLASSATQIFHKEWDNTVVGPNFYYRDLHWSAMKDTNSKTKCPFHVHSLK